MGNNSSFSRSEGDENLLRRNARHLLRSTTSGDDEPNRNIRSRSLEPRATQEIRVVEHSKSVRYSRKKNSSSVPRLWNPNDPRFLSLSRSHQYEANRTLDGSRSPSPGLASTEHPCITGMTRHHKMILQKIWMRALDSDKEECSRNILSHLFRSNNQLYQIFNLVDMTDKEIASSSKFARLSSNFAEVFGFVISNFDDLKRVSFALEQLGAHHANFGFPIPQTYWALFTRVFEDNPPKLIFQNPEGHNAWKLMINFVIRTMHNGYARETKNSAVRKVSSNNTLHADRAS